MGVYETKACGECADAVHQASPEITVHPVGQTRARRSKSDDRPRIQLIDPHLVCEEPEQRRLRVLEWINLRESISILRPSFPIKPDAQRDPTADERKRNEKHRLDHARNVEVNRFAREIT